MLVERPSVCVLASIVDDESCDVKVVHVLVLKIEWTNSSVYERNPELPIKRLQLPNVFREQVYSLQGIEPQQ